MSSPTETYQHSQSHIAGTALTALIALVVLVLVITDSITSEGFEELAFLVPVFIVISTLIVFSLSKLTTTVTPTHVQVAFRWGWPKRTIALSDIGIVEATRNKWWYGIGIRFIPNSTMMFNVWGLDAVHLELHSRRNFRIGTDDPDGLEAAINHQLSRPN